MKYFILLLIVFSGAATGFSQIDLDAGLVVSLPMTGNTNDASGNNNHGAALNGPILTTDRFGVANHAFQLDGIDDFIAIADPLKEMSTTPFSIVLWFNSSLEEVMALIGKREYGPFNGQQYQFAVFRDGTTTLSSAVVSNALSCGGDLSPDVLNFATYTGPLCINKWYCVIITFNGQLHRIYLDGIKVSESSPHFPAMVECASELRLGNWWNGDPLSFKGKLDDFRWYNRILNDDEIRELNKDRPATLPGKTEFQFEQNFCNPKTFSFNVMQSNFNVFRWNFGDGSNQNSQKNPVHSYRESGTYPVRLIAGSGYCADTTEKILSTSHLTEKLISQNDTLICKGSEITLRTVNPGTFCWNESVTVSEIKVRPDKKTVYTVTTQRVGKNLITNGNFSAGNSGYTSDYFYNNPNSGLGQIFIGSKPENWNSDFCNDCGDHTTGTGNFLMVNAPLTDNSRVWYRNIPVLKNTAYSFSFWIFTNATGNQPSVVVNINNKKIGEYNTVTGDNGSWTNVSFGWNSENSTTAAIAIISTNLSAADGNDFGLDDISFFSKTIITDSVTIDVKDKIGRLTAIADTGICPGEFVKLGVSGSLLVKWLPATSLSDVNSLNPIARPFSTTSYIVSSTDPFRCPANDTVVVTVKDKPAVKVSNDTLLCSGQPGVTGVQLSARGGENYKWFPSAGLNNANIANPVAIPSATTLYQVFITGSSGCKDTGTVKITVKDFVNIKASADASVCIGKSVNLSATGGSDYKWSPAIGLSATNISNPIATPLNTISYFVNSPSAGACSGKDTVIVTAYSLPAVVLTPGDTLMCTNSKIQLNATGGVQYAWSPLAGLSNAFIPNPLAEPAEKTVYTLEVTDLNGCKSSKQVTIDVKNTVVIKASDDATICAGKSVRLSGSGAVDYLWTPAIGLSSSNIANPEASPVTNTLYVLSSPSAGLCSKNDTVLVKVNPVPEITLTPLDPLVCLGASIELTASGAINYSWFPSTGINDPTSATPLITPQFTTNFTVIGVDINGCVDSARTKITVGPASKIYIPNAFTPNNDGVNDCYSIKNAVGAASFELAIFNRWGERVYYSKNPGNCWDGRYKERPQPAGNFIYYLRVKSDCGSIEEKGNILLIR